MSDEERGLYMRLMNHSWLNGGLPTNEDDLAELIGKPLTHPKWAKRVCRKFTLVDGRLVNPTQEEFRSKAISKSEKATKSVRTRYERSTEEPIRASDSVSISSSCSKSSSEELQTEERSVSRADAKPAEPIPLPKVPGRLDEGWLTLEILAEECGMVASDIERPTLYSAVWLRLGMERQLSAVDCLRRRTASGEYAPGISPTLDNYLRKGLWTRVDRPRTAMLDPPKKPSKLAMVEQISRELDEEFEANERNRKRN